MCQFHNSLEVEFLPVYNPSDEEMNQPKLFARNVQIFMAKAMGVPYTNHAFEDVLLMRSARKGGLPFRSGMVVYQGANRDLNMDLSTMKKWLRRFIAIDGDKDGFINIDDFARILQVPNDAQLQAVFNAAEMKDGKMNYRNYLYGVIGKARPLLQDASFMQAMFNFFDSDGDGIVSEADLSGHIPISSLRDDLHSNHQERQRQQHRSKHRGDDDASGEAHRDGVATIPEKMNLDQFTSLLENHPEHVLIFYKSHHHALPDATNINPNHDIQSAYVGCNDPGVDHSFTLAGNGQASTAYSYSHMTQAPNEHHSSSSLMVEAEVIQPSLSHAVQTTVTIEIEER